MDKNHNPIPAPSLLSKEYVSLLFCTLIAAVLVGYYLYMIKPYVFLPADILMWAETNFVGDIIKIKKGIPIYTDPTDSNSLIYTPGAPILTYAIAKLFGQTDSIAVWRMIQLLFVFCAALLAAGCARMLWRLSRPKQPLAFPGTWFVFSFLVLFLAATAPRTSTFAHCLHVDALALLVSVLSFWSILFYQKSPNWKRLLLMAFCPAFGYLTKQFLISWAAVMFIFLLWDNPREIRRLLVFTVATTCFLALTITGCYLLWGDNFIFWTFGVMGGPRKEIVLTGKGFHMSLFRSFDHLLRAWMEVGIGVFGGWMILRGRYLRSLAALWLSWLALIASEALSSGAGWSVLYHFGPGVVIGTIWLCAALPGLWNFPKGSGLSDWTERSFEWIRPLIGIAGVLNVFIALHVMPTADEQEARYWKRRPPHDVYRYITDIEHEFDGLPVEKVLLDVGNWIYLKHSFLAKDRAVSLADQPPNGVYENINLFVEHIRNRVYQKILVRDLDSAFFLYDWALWERPSGVRDALRQNYTVVRTIPGVKGDPSRPPIIMHSGPVSVLVPKIQRDE